MISLLLNPTPITTICAQRERELWFNRSSVNLRPDPCSFFFVFSASWTKQKGNTHRCQVVKYSSARELIKRKKKNEFFFFFFFRRKHFFKNYFFKQGGGKLSKTQTLWWVIYVTFSIFYFFVVNTLIVFKEKCLKNFVTYSGGKKIFFFTRRRKKNVLTSSTRRKTGKKNIYTFFSPWQNKWSVWLLNHLFSFSIHTHTHTGGIWHPHVNKKWGGGDTIFTTVLLLDIV